MQGSSGLLNYALIIFLALVLVFVFMKIYEDQKQAVTTAAVTTGNTNSQQVTNAALAANVVETMGELQNFEGFEGGGDTVQPTTTVTELTGYNNSGDFADVLASVPQSENSGNAVFKTCDLNKISPEELLPSQNNTQFAKLNPTVASNLQNKNFLEAGAHIGLDTVGQSLRNASYDLRAETPNPRMNVSPWMNTTIQPDLAKKPLV
jgi:hypothetical protein|tara:strand:- start:192 stop:809 length:618 start_codon:yes stop_codon:yes gene_type:complete